MYATDWGGGKSLLCIAFFLPPPRLSAAVIGVFLPSTAFSIVLLYRRSLQAALKGSPPFQISFGNSMRCSCRFSAFAIVWGEGRVLFLYYAFSAHCAVCCVLCIQYTLRIALCTQYSAVPRCGSVSCFFLLRHAKLETRN